MKDKRQRLQSIVWPYNMAAAAAAAAAADQSGLYAYIMHASLLNAAQYAAPYSRPVLRPSRPPHHPASLSPSCGPGASSSTVALAAALQSAAVAAAAASPLSYVTSSSPTATSGRPVAPFESLDCNASVQSLMAARQKALLAAQTSSTEHSAACRAPAAVGLQSTPALFRPYQSLVVGVASD